MKAYRSIQKEIYQKHPMLGVETDLPAEGVLPGRPVPAWLNKGPVYEIFVRAFSREGKFAGVEKKCAWLHDLGVKTIWLMPIHPIGLDGRKGKLGSPYAISDHREINPEYGTKKDFKRLVDAIHDHDMHIIIDMVLNHTARDHFEHKQHPEMYNKSFLRCPGEWSDVRELNYDVLLTQQYALDSLIYWVKDFGIDGYRCDVAGMVPRDFWEMAVPHLLDINPDIYMLAEWDNRALHNRAFHSNYDWTAYLLMKEILAGRAPASDLLIWNQEHKKTYPANTLPLRFTENHDLPRTIETFGRNKFYPFLAFTIFADAIPLIYNGQEIGSGAELSLFDLCKIDWDARDERILEFYRKMIRIRNANLSFMAQEKKNLLNDYPETVVTLTGTDHNDMIIVILNFSDKSGRVKIQVPQMTIPGVYTDLVADIKIIPEQGKFMIEPWQVQVLKKN